MDGLKDQNIVVLRVKVFPGGVDDSEEAAFACFVHALVNGQYVVRSAAGPTPDGAYTAAYAKLTQPIPKRSDNGDDLPF